MDSVVIELQREALDRNVRISDLLRKALVVARKLKISEFENWIDNELNGYEKTEDIPDYREVAGEVKAWNPYHGWQPVFFEEPRLKEVLSRRPCAQTIAETENLVEGKSGTSQLQLPFPPRIEQDIQKAIGLTTQVTLIVPYTFLVRILDTVRTIVLNWSLKLEEDGILGEGMSFTNVEKKTAGNTSYNINNFYGQVQGAQIQQDTSESMQISTEQFDFEALREFIKTLQDRLNELNFSPGIEQELQAELETVQTQAASPKPKNNIIKESLGTIRRILEGASGGLATQLLLQLGSLL